ncbi:glycosyltransferase family 9 protein [Aureibacter tunicatorum]|uniref:Heptosyltransferase-2 n=1 Tax=Aureibacter tunicatorum TaxID=866807 RepID=A0AAE4BTI3_9BACT|nr:glycosyltransferase family 9 protein [Aureibacter tunicatorum]MDR6239637.1 heptosyltransferase-2 [Aureibacter tunicatorum]BDD04113.1 ADP-heptosyltransferase [Aureibacter tunicatorum]
MNSNALQKILVIQTAFIGDVILATAMLEKLHHFHPNAKIDFLVRKGNESLLKDHPYLNEVLVFDKTKGKYKNLWNMIMKIRSTEYDYVVNAQRFATTGIITALSGAKVKIGFDKNPMSFLFTKKYPHEIAESNTNKISHEVDRNQLLISDLTDTSSLKPKLYPLESDFEITSIYKNGDYICLAPTSVWFTKQYPKEKWIEFIDQIEEGLKVYLLGAPGDKTECDDIIKKCNRSNVENLAGKLNLLQSAALMKDSKMNYVNDSAPMHLCSAVDAPVCAIYCSTVPYFGFGPLSSDSYVVETHENLDCRPCGLHGYKECPKGHFNCAKTIQVNDLLKLIKA